MYINKGFLYVTYKRVDNKGRAKEGKKPPGHVVDVPHYLLKPAGRFLSRLHLRHNPVVGIGKEQVLLFAALVECNRLPFYALAD